MGTGSVELLDWRRRVADLYAEVRGTAGRGGADAAATAHGVWRAGRDALFAAHPQSPLAADDPRREHGLPVAPYDPVLRLSAALVPEPAAGGDDPPAADAELVVQTGTDGVVTFTRLGHLELPVGRLDVWWLSGYGGGVWLPVRDGSGGRTSYGGGRYLLDTVKGADLGASGDGEVVVDLNFLYNPSCAYDEAWACPLAPPGNRLEAALEVGELMPG